MDWNDLAQDRDLWALVNAVMYFRLSEELFSFKEGFCSTKLVS